MTLLPRICACGLRYRFIAADRKGKRGLQVALLNITRALSGQRVSRLCDAGCEHGERVGRFGTIGSVERSGGRSGFAHLLNT